MTYDTEVHDWLWWEILYWKHICNSQIMAFKKFTTSPHQSPVASKAEIINSTMDYVG